MNDLEPLSPEPWDASNEPWLAPDGDEELIGPGGTEPPMTAQSRRFTTRGKVLIGSAAVVVLIAAGFVAGATTGGTSPIVGFTDAATSATSVGASACAPVFPGSPGRRALSGTVASVDAGHSTFAVSGSSAPVTVSVTSATNYTKTQLGGPADLTKGAHVLIRGTRATDGSVNAQQIVLVPATSATAPGGSGRAGSGTIAASNLTNGVGSLTIAVPGGTKNVNVATNTKIYKTAPATFADVGTGDPVVVAGRSSAANAVTATLVAVGQSGQSAPLGPLGPFGAFARRRALGSQGAAPKTPSGGPCTAPAPAAGRNAAVGTVSNLNGGDFTVTSRRGTINVTTTSATTYTKQIQESGADIAPGSQVLAFGTASGNGASIAASQIAVSPGPSGGGPKMSARPSGSAGAAHGLVGGTVAANDKTTSTLTVTSPDGSTHQVTYTPTTKVTATVPATLKDVANNDPVTVTGTTAADGSLTAAHVSIGQPGQPGGPPGLGPFGRPGFGRRGPPGSPAPGGGSATVPGKPLTPSGTTNQPSVAGSGTVI